jgi:hypothetical protein
MKPVARLESNMICAGGERADVEVWMVRGQR